MSASVVFAFALIFAVDGFKLQPPTPILATIPPGCNYHGKMYACGQSFQPTPCKHCQCSSMGQVFCAIADCFYTPCVNPIHDPTKCCPVCPDGQNCFYGKTIIPAGKVYKPDNYTTCTCDEHPHFGFNRQAICAKTVVNTVIPITVN